VKWHNVPAEISMTRVIVVIPTYNEAENLPLLVPAVLRQDPRIEMLVVDDNSPDGTGKLADDLAQGDGRIHVLHRPAKEGIGRAYIEGLRMALRLDADFVIQMDADFSHPPDDLPRLLQEIENGNNDVVLGSRYLNGVTVVEWPIERILISYFGNWYVRKVTGMSIRDMTGGFRCIRRAVLEAMDFDGIHSDGHAFLLEMNYRFVKMGARIKEIPFYFVDRARGTTKLTLRIALESLWMPWWLRIESLLGRIGRERLQDARREL
jgi:dolichol-phosphate mannosyltransferase